MNKTTEALKLAEDAANRVIKALEYLKTIGIHPDSLDPVIRAEKKVLIATREALADHIADTGKMIAETVKTYEQGYLDGYDAGLIFANSRVEPVKQEPVAWWNGKETAWFEHELCGWQAPDGCTIPLYAAPVSAKREWVDLTDGEIHELVLTWEAHALVRAVIAAFKEKNK